MASEGERCLPVDMGSRSGRVLGQWIGHHVSGGKDTTALQWLGRTVVIARLAEGVTGQGAVLEWDRHGSG
jgi:hypothetical protein